MKSYSPKKLICLADILITVFCCLAKDRDPLLLELEESEYIRKDLVAAIIDQKKITEILGKENSELLAQTADLREHIVKPLIESKPESSKKGKEIFSEEYVRLENEVKALRSRMSAEIEKADLENVINDLEKSLKWTWSVEATISLSTNVSEEGGEQGSQGRKILTTLIVRAPLHLITGLVPNVGTLDTSWKVFRLRISKFQKIKWLLKL